MKTFVVAIIILIIMVTGSYIYVCWLDSTVVKLNESLQAMDAYVFAKDWTSCGMTMEEVNNQWKKAFPMLSYFMYHFDLDTINQTINEINRCIEIQNGDMFLIRNKKLQELLKQLTAAEELCIENIL